MKVATKRKGAWLWGGAITREEVEAAHAAGSLAANDLVCPVGMAEEAVTVVNYLESPTVFDRLFVKAEPDRTQDAGQSQTSKPVEGFLVVALTILAGVIVAFGFAMGVTGLRSEVTFEGALMFLISCVGVALLVLAVAAILRVLLRIEAAVSKTPDEAVGKESQASEEQ